MQDSGLENALVGLYSGPLEDFVLKRDLLAKELRAAGRGADAKAVKALRKASRTAWALNVAAVESRPALAAVQTAFAAAVQAHAGDGNVRSAIAELRAAVRDFATAAAQAAARAGHRLEQALLANAVLAVLGSTDAFIALCSGRLVEVPEAGGLDFFANLPAPEGGPRAGVVDVASNVVSSSRDSAPALSPARVVPSERDVLEKAAREARNVLDVERKRVTEAERLLREVESRLGAAEALLQRAEADARALRIERDRARVEVDEATERLAGAQRAAREAERQLENL